MRRSAGLAAALFFTALGLAGCGHGTVIGSGPLPTAKPVPPSVAAEYTVPTANAAPAGLTSARDGFDYFGEENAGNIGQISLGGAVKEFGIAANGGTAGNDAYGITSGPDGNLWFTERGTSPGIGTMKIAGNAVTEYPIAGSSPAFIITGPATDSLVFTDPGHNAIGQISTAGAVTETTIPTANANPLGLTVGPNQMVYFVEHDASKIGIYDPVAKTITEIQTLTPNAGPTAIALGPGGAVWFTENNVAQAGWLNGSGTMKEFPLTPAASATAMTIGADNNLYFTDPVQNKIGVLNLLTLQASEFSVPTGNAFPVPPAFPGQMSLNANSLVIFTEPLAGKIGVISY